jgi:PAB1-binding protein PBP1
LGKRARAPAVRNAVVPCDAQHPNNNLTTKSQVKMSIEEMEGVMQEPSSDFKTNFALLERAVAQFDTRFILRSLRSISSLRKKLADTKIAQIAKFDSKKSVAEVLVEAEKELTGDAKKESVPEIRIYIAILIQVRTSAATSEVDVKLTQYRSICGIKNDIKMALSSHMILSTRFAN